ncbi:MAG: hypothetical protein V3R80_11385 [Candidatus Tectomicrobia bacterium]
MHLEVIRQLLITKSTRGIRGDNRLMPILAASGYSTPSWRQPITKRESNSVLTTNPADFTTFGLFTCITPSTSAPPF